MFGSLKAFHFSESLCRANHIHYSSSDVCICVRVGCLHALVRLETNANGETAASEKHSVLMQIAVGTQIV